MSDTKIFGREDILAAKAKRNVIKIDDVPGLGGSVYIRELKRGEFKAWLDKSEESDAKLLAEVLCDANGNLLFDPNNEEDVKSIEESFTAKGFQYLGKEALVRNSANPEIVEKNLQASLSTVSNSN